MTTGTIVRFNDEKGYGFIETDASDEDVFFHIHDLDGPEPREGMKIEFALTETPKGPRAKRIQLQRMDSRAL